jgi:hypothetical protein
VAEHDNQQSNVTNQMNARPMPKNEASELVVQTFPKGRSGWYIEKNTKRRIDIDYFP